MKPRNSKDGLGTRETATVVACPGLAFPEGQLPVRIRLALEDGTALLVPITDDAARELRDVLVSMKSLDKK
jgi:hypothetical protein